MKRKIWVLITSITLISLIAVGGTLAWLTNKAEITNVITMGNVNIKLEEPIYSSSSMSVLSNGSYVKKDLIFPGDSFVKDPTITNIGNNPCYIRAKVDLVMDVKGDPIPSNTVYKEDDTPLVIHPEDFFQPNDGWVKGDGGYYYYNEAVPATGTGSVVELFKTAKDGKTIHVPSAWGNEISNVSFHLNISAEAIQSENFTPQTDENKQIIGWNGVTVETYDE